MPPDPEQTDPCEPGEHSLAWSEERLMLVCERCGRSARTLSNDQRLAADQ